MLHSKHYSIAQVVAGFSHEMPEAIYKLSSFLIVSSYPSLLSLFLFFTGNATYKLTTEILNAMNNKLLVGGIFL